jgi:hypothetical protein
LRYRIRSISAPTINAIPPSTVQIPTIVPAPDGSAIR